MTVARQKKITVIGPASCETEALETLQDLGCMHLLPLSPPPERPEERRERAAKDAYAALRFLASAPNPRRQVRRDPAFDIERFVAQVLELRERLRETSDRRDFLEKRIADIRPWGDIVFPPHEELAGHRLWFYRLPVKDRAALDRVELPWEIVREGSRYLYVVLLSHDEPPRDVLPVARTHVGALPIRELEEQLEDTRIALEDIEAERHALTRYLDLMRESLSQAETRAELEFARQQILRDEALFAVQGWVPESRGGEVEAAAEALGCAALIEEPAPGETPPTLLEAPESRAAEVDLTLFYAAPGYDDPDPSRFVSISFVVFFAVILADAGYGLLIALIVAFFWRRMAGGSRLRSWRRLLAAAAAGTVAYGMLVGSYFGVAPDEGSPLASLAMLSVDDFDTMMRLSIGVGVLHLVAANLMSAQARGWRGKGFANLGWCAALIGGFALWLGQGTWAAQAAAALAGAGLLAVFAFSSDRPMSTPKDAAMRVFGGLSGLAGAMGAFGDVLSYMRLFALGLASASLAATFNSLAGQVRDEVQGLGLLLALLILLVGHALNFGLALMSGVVHGLRLNYIEFFKWALSGEGVPFRPFARKEVEE